MADINLIVSGALFNGTKDDVKQVFVDVYKEAADQLKEMIIQEFNNSVMLNSIVGKYTDPEALKTILRSVKVDLTNDWPPNINIKFQDDLNHWYGGELPQELIDTINEIYDSAIYKWSLDRKFEENLLNAVSS